MPKRSTFRKKNRKAPIRAKKHSKLDARRGYPAQLAPNEPQQFPSEQQSILGKLHKPDFLRHVFEPEHPEEEGQKLAIGTKRDALDGDKGRSQIHTYY